MAIATSLCVVAMYMLYWTRKGEDVYREYIRSLSGGNRTACVPVLGGHHVPGTRIAHGLIFTWCYIVTHVCAAYMEQHL